MDYDEPVDQIRAQMAEVRSKLSDDVQDLGHSARAMTDVGHYVRRFPWATVAVALAIGYLLVPKKRQRVYPDPALLAKMIEQKQLRVEASPQESSPKSVLKSLVATGLMTAARTGMGLVAQRLASSAASNYRMPEPARGPHEPLTM